MANARFASSNMTPYPDAIDPRSDKWKTMKPWEQQLYKDMCRRAKATRLRFIMDVARCDRHTATLAWRTAGIVPGHTGIEAMILWAMKHAAEEATRLQQQCKGDLASRDEHDDELASDLGGPAPNPPTPTSTARQASGDEGSIIDADNGMAMGMHKVAADTAADIMARCLPFGMGAALLDPEDQPPPAALMSTNLVMMGFPAAKVDHWCNDGSNKLTQQLVYTTLTDVLSNGSRTQCTGSFAASGTSNRPTVLLDEEPSTTISVMALHNTESISGQWTHSLSRQQEA